MALEKTMSALKYFSPDSRVEGRTFSPDTRQVSWAAGLDQQAARRARALAFSLLKVSFLLLLSPTFMFAAGEDSIGEYTGITRVESRADGKVKIYHDSGISSVDSASLPKEFLASWGAHQVTIEPPVRAGVLTAFDIPGLDIEPVERIKNLFGELKRGEFETLENYQKRLAALKPKQITFLVTLRHNVDFDPRTGTVTVKAGGYQIKGDTLVLAVSLERTFGVRTDFVNRLGIRVDGTMESYGTVVLNVPLSRAGRVKDYFDPTRLTGLDEKYRKLTPYLFHDDYGSGALKFYDEFHDLLAAGNEAFRFSYNSNQNPDIQPNDLSVMITASIRPVPMMETNLGFQLPTVKKPAAQIYEGWNYHADLVRIGLYNSRIGKVYYLLNFGP